MILGHRGAKGLVLENTYESFQKAYSLNCDGIELDLQITQDNVLIIHHDDTLDRLCYKNQYYKTVQNKKISELKWETIQKCTLIDIQNQKYKILSLSNLLFDSTLFFKIIDLEIKDPKCSFYLPKLLNKVFSETRYKPDNFILTSYYKEAIKPFGKPKFIETSETEENLTKHMYFQKEEIEFKGIVFDSDEFIKTDYKLGIIIDNWSLKKFGYTNINQYINDLDFEIDVIMIGKDIFHTYKLNGYKIGIFTVNEKMDIETDYLITDFPDIFKT